MEIETTTIGNLPNEIICIIGLHIKPIYIAVALLSIRPLADFFRSAAKCRDTYVAYQQSCAWPASEGRETDATHFLGRPHGQITTNHPDYKLSPQNDSLYSFGKLIKSVDFCPQTGYPNKFTTPTSITQLFDNGELSRVELIKDGKRHGDSFVFKKKGRISKMMEYRDGLLHGKFTRYYIHHHEDRNKKSFESTYFNGRKEGFAISYYTGGEIKCISPQKNGKTVGTVSYFHKNHELKGKEIGIHVMRALGCCPVPPGLSKEVIITGCRKLIFIYDKNGILISSSVR